MVALAFLGFREQRTLPLNDKLLHFLCFMIATGAFYFIVDIEEYVLLRVSIQRCLANNGLSPFMCTYCQECEENMVLEIFQPHLHVNHLLLLWWDFE